MSEYQFTYEDTEYILNAHNCSELINDEDIDYSSWTAHDWTNFWQNKIKKKKKK